MWIDPYMTSFWLFTICAFEKVIFISFILFVIQPFFLYKCFSNNLFYGVLVTFTHYYNNN